MSFFEQIDKQSCSSDKFWTRIENQSEISDKIEYSNTHGILNKKGELKSRYFIVTSSQMFYCKNSNTRPKKFTNIHFKAANFLKSEDENEDSLLINSEKISRFEVSDYSSKRSILRLGHHPNCKDFYLTSKSDLITLSSVLYSISVLETFESDFTVVNEISSNAHGKLLLVYDLTKLQYFAVRAINKEFFLSSHKTFESLACEISIMRKLDHSQIVKLHFVYEDTSYVYLVLDYVEHGDLFHRIILKNRFSEDTTSKLMKNLLSALEYIHSKNVIYRDLKPQNILLESENSDFSIKINHFGLACDLNDSQDYRCGSPGYVAPEILKKKPYSKKADIFSAGIIMFTLISGRAPFYGKKPAETFQRNKECKIYFHDKFWKSITKEGIDLVLKLTDSDPEFRLTATEALTHNWFKMDLPSSVEANAIPISQSEGGISAELMRRMNKVRGETVKKEEDSPITESQRKVLNTNSKNILSRLRNFDSMLN